MPDPGFIVIIFSIFLFPFLLLLISMYVGPTIMIITHPWICTRDPGEFDYGGSFLSYVNWWYRISGYKCRMKKDVFRKRWLLSSTIYALGMILILVFVFAISADSPVCLLLLIPALIGADALLRNVAESILIR